MVAYEIQLQYVHVIKQQGHHTRSLDSKISQDNLLNGYRIMLSTNIDT